MHAEKTTQNEYSHFFFPLLQGTELYVNLYGKGRDTLLMPDHFQSQGNRLRAAGSPAKRNTAAAEDVILSADGQKATVNTDTKLEVSWPLQVEQVITPVRSAASRACWERRP